LNVWAHLMMDVNTKLPELYSNRILQYRKENNPLFESDYLLLHTGFALVIGFT
jgi:hypothetical protein